MLTSVVRLRMNQQGIETHEWKWQQVKETCLDIKSFFWFALMFSISLDKFLRAFKRNILTVSQNPQRRYLDLRAINYRSIRLQPIRYNSLQYSFRGCPAHRNYGRSVDGNEASDEGSCHSFALLACHCGMCDVVADSPRQSSQWGTACGILHCKFL